MYPYEDRTDAEGMALNRLTHPDGEEYSGAHNADKQLLLNHGWSIEEVEHRFGKLS